MRFGMKADSAFEIMLSIFSPANEYTNQNIRLISKRTDLSRLKRVLSLESKNNSIQNRAETSNLLSIFTDILIPFKLFYILFELLRHFTKYIAIHFAQLLHSRNRCALNIHGCARHF